MPARPPAHEDKEVKAIARKILDKFPKFFPEDFVLGKIYCMRTEEITPKKWIARIRPIGHPWCNLPLMSHLTYLLEVADERWALLSEAQRNLVIFHELLHVPKGGCDPECNKHGTLKDHAVQDFPECIAAADGNLFWMQTGAEIPDILDDRTTKLDLAKSLEKAGYSADPEREPFPIPEGDDLSDDPIEDMLKEASKKEEITEEDFSEPVDVNEEEPESVEVTEV